MTYIRQPKRIIFTTFVITFTTCTISIKIKATVKDLKKENHSIMATISYSYFSDRVYAIGTNNRGNIIEKPFNSLDFIFKAEFNKLGIGISFKNLLNQSIERYQANLDSDVLVISYKKGVLTGLKISYKF